MKKDDAIELCGRRRIYTDEFNIDEGNIISVLQEAIIDHTENMAAISFLINYEKGDQPLKREKVVRKDIDVEVCDNIANEVTEFKLSYNWGNPIEYVQRSDLFPKDSTKEIDDSAITLLNNMLKSEYINTKNQELARYLEVCGVGYKLIDVKRDYDGGSVFDVAILNPLYSFVVYGNDVFHKPLLGVSFRVAKDGTIYYTCYTKDMRFEIKNAIEIVKGTNQKKDKYINTYTEKNPLGMVSIIEYNRSTDRTGCFERQVTDMDNVNILVSDFTNDVAQNTQAIWHANDVDFPIDETNGEVKPPVSNQWACTYTTKDGKTPFIKPMATQYDYSGILENIRYRRDVILQKCNVPLRSEPGGGSTGTAMSMSSGWSDAECSASKEALIVEKSELMAIKAIIKAIKVSPDLEADSELLKLNASDIEIHFIRNKTYDMATKANSFATYVSHGINGRDALAMVDATSNIEAVYTNSKENIDKYQESLFEKNEKTNSETEERNQSDLSDQTSNSPIIGNNIK